MAADAGTVTLSVEEVANQNASIQMKLRGQGFSNCQPFVRLSRTREVAGGALDKAPVFKTEVTARPLLLEAAGMWQLDGFACVRVGRGRW